MNFIATLITGLINVLVLPFGSTHHTLELVWLSLLTGLGMAYVFKLTSNQKAIKLAKDRVKARILEMRLYQDDPVLIFRGLGGALKGNFAYLGKIVVPFIVIVIPVAVIFMQLDERYSRAYLRPGSSTFLSVQLKEGFDPFEMRVGLKIEGEGVVVDGTPVRDAVTRETDWQLRVERGGTHQVTLSAGGSSYSFPIVAEKSYRMIGRERNSSSFIEPLLHPAMPPIPADSPIDRVRVNYSSASHWLLGWGVHWIVIFLVYSLISAAALKFLIKIEI